MSNAVKLLRTSLFTVPIYVDCTKLSNVLDNRCILVASD